VETLTRRELIGTEHTQKYGEGKGTSSLINRTPSRGTHIHFNPGKRERIEHATQTHLIFEDRQGAAIAVSNSAFFRVDCATDVPLKRMAVKGVPRPAAIYQPLVEENACCGFGRWGRRS
jgi:hypothetical protein